MSESNPLDWDTEDEDAPFDLDDAAASLEAMGAAWLRLAPTIYGSALQIHATSGDLKLGDTLTWESKPKPWSIWRFWRKAKPTQLNTFVVTSV